MSKVGVIGGGLGGLAAACTLAARGHDVVLFEKSSWLGGKAAVLEARHCPADVRLAPPAAGIRHGFGPCFAVPLTAFRPARLPPASRAQLFPLAAAFF